MVLVGAGASSTSLAAKEPDSLTAMSPQIATDDVKLNVEKVSLKRTTIAYAELGSGSELLLLNGTGSPMADWDPALLAGLAQTHRVVVFDYPGLGESTKAPKKITFPRLARWSFELLDQLGIASSHVMGWSMGGFVAQEMMAQRPDRIRHARKQSREFIVAAPFATAADCVR